MGDEIKVHVVEFSDRKYYMMQYRDPTTGRKRTRSTKVERTGRKKGRTQEGTYASRTGRGEVRGGVAGRPLLPCGFLELAIVPRSI